VLDKEPAVPEVWLFYGTLALVGFWLCQKSRWWSVLFLPLSIALFMVGTEDLWDRWVGQEIWRESPSLYIQWHIAMALAIVAPSFGFLAASWRSKHAVTPAETVQSIRHPLEK
jgi:hypothetical protein